LTHQPADFGRLTEEILATQSDSAALSAVTGQLADPQKFLSGGAYLYAYPDESSHEEIHLNDGRTFDLYSAPGPRRGLDVPTTTTTTTTTTAPSDWHSSPTCAAPLARTSWCFTTSRR
jgi:hypothetical protein